MDILSKIFLTDLIMLATVLVSAKALLSLVDNYNKIVNAILYIFAAMAIIGLCALPIIGIIALWRI